MAGREPVEEGTGEDAERPDLGQKHERSHLRGEINFAFVGDTRICVVTETEPFGLMPTKIEIPFSLLKEAVAQILSFEAQLEIAKLPKIAQNKQHRDSWPQGIRGKIRVSELLIHEARTEIQGRGIDVRVDELGKEAGKIAGKIERESEAERKPAQRPGFDV